MLAVWEKHICIDRCRSAPPTSRPELGPVPHGRLDYTVDLYIDRDLLKPFADVKVLRESTSTTVMLVDGKYILKLLPAPHDVQETVAIMKLAGTVVPVPHVYSYGYSGNCSFIFMQYVEGCTLDKYIRKNGRHLSTHPFVLKSIEHIVRSLAVVGISHNDLYPRNVIVDEFLRVLSVIDWDGAGPWHKSQEYTRRAQLGTLFGRDLLEYEPWLHDWDHIFRKYCPDVMECLANWPTLPYLPRCTPRCKDPWSGFWRPDYRPGPSQCFVLKQIERITPECFGYNCHHPDCIISSPCTFLFNSSFQRLVNIGPFKASVFRSMRSI
ncbi:hypothetical protein OBBRIDRAFT_824860 [Obba rivulosa]|uniref:Protein kinase domain-containing protein n=1 Tax=Obba rivulosa TaxID=1052685 RepID=A0A8E2AXI7_9APHY|nr:hypothetical protein OBBRIDRAFT_824860 [Obba rivulosa]